jgi:plasmid stabilization system protein ParE
MRYSVRLNNQAAADLADIVLFIARDNPAAAEKLGLALVETAFSLATFPYRGQQMKSRPKARKLIYGKYLIVYEVREAHRHVEILRFLHGARIR